MRVLNQIEQGGADSGDEKRVMHEWNCCWHVHVNSCWFTMTISPASWAQQTLACPSNYCIMQGVHSIVRCFLDKVGEVKLVGRGRVHLTNKQNTRIRIAHKRLIMLPRDAFWEPKCRKMCLQPGPCFGSSEHSPISQLDLGEGKDWEKGTEGKDKGRVWCDMGEGCLLALRGDGRPWYCVMPRLHSEASSSSQLDLLDFSLMVAISNIELSW